MRAYTHGGWAHRQRVSTTCWTRKNSHNVVRVPDASGVPTSGLWIWIPTGYPLSHPVTLSPRHPVIPSPQLKQFGAQKTRTHFRRQNPHTVKSVSSVISISAVHDGIYVLGKARMHSTPSLRSFPTVTLETVPMLV